MIIFHRLVQALFLLHFTAVALPGDWHRVDYSAVYQQTFIQTPDLAFTARTPPLASGNVTIAGSVLTGNGDLRALNDVGVQRTFLNFDADLIAPNRTVELPGGVSVQGRPVNPSHAPEAPTPRYEVSPAQAEQYLRDMGVPDQQATSFVQSFDGPIYIRERRVSETFGTYFSPGCNNTAQFLTPSTAGQVVDNLALPDGNYATNFNAATINQPIGVLEGVIAPQNWTRSNPLPGGGQQVFVPGGSQFGTAPVTIGGSLQ